jgi:transposase-like protein
MGSITCPQCGSTEVRYSHRRGWERLLIVLLLRPYRCENCRRRCWRFGRF